LKIATYNVNGEPEGGQSRDLEAAGNSILIGALHLFNGNPRPGRTFDYKMRWSSGRSPTPAGCSRPASR